MSITALPSMQHTFTISVKGLETGQMFDGTFTYQRPNLKARSDIAKTIAFLNGDLKNIDEDTKLIHHIAATLRHTLVKYPEWWEKEEFGFALYDTNVLFEIYTETRKFEKEWSDKVWKVEDKKTEEKK